MPFVLTQLSVIPPPAHIPDNADSSSGGGWGRTLLILLFIGAAAGGVGFYMHKQSQAKASRFQF